MTQKSAPAPRRARTVAHYLLLLMSIYFALLFVVFLSAAISSSQRNPSSAMRSLLLSLVVFATATTALAAFIRRLPKSGWIFIGLFLLQPGASVLIAVASGGSPEHMARNLAAGVVGIAILIYAGIAPRSARETAG